MEKNESKVNTAETVNAAESVNATNAKLMTREEFSSILEEMRDSLLGESLFTNHKKPKPLMRQKTIGKYIITVIIFPEKNEMVFTYYADDVENELVMAEPNKDCLIDGLWGEIWDYNSNK